MKTLTDKQIIEQLLSPKVAERDKAFKFLYRKELPFIENFIMANNGKRIDARDIFQEALVVLFTKVCIERGFKLEYTLRAYLRGVCHNLWLKKLRDNKPTENIDFVEEETLPYDKTIEDLLILDDESKLMASYLAQLGPRCQELIDLFYFRRVRMKKIAIIMNFSSEQVAKNKKGKCLKAFRAKIKDEKLFQKFFKEE